MSKQLHIVLLDNPYPPNYGGAVDMWNKIKALHRLGVELTIHCFVYGNRKSWEALQNYGEVIIYPRDTSKKHLLSKKPFIVVSRTDSRLLNNLAKDQFPILFEGLHTCGFLKNELLEKRKKIVRCHNIEHDYYWGLSQNNETGFFKKQFFQMESKKLKRFEKILSYADHILAISKSDTDYFEQYGETNLIPAFHNDYSVDDHSTEKYILFQGNMEVEENRDAVLKLIENVFSKVDHKTIIAGKNPSDKIFQAAERCPNIEIVANPKSEPMGHLIANAHIHLLYSAQDTGIKLKLIHALFSKGHIIINEHLAFNELCLKQLEIANTWQKMQSLLEKLWSEDKVKDRTEICQEFDNIKNAQKIIDLVF